jgi:hypothetical protein
VSPLIYRRYFSAAGPLLFVGFALAVLTASLNVLKEFWLSAWSDDAAVPQQASGLSFGARLGFNSFEY